MLSMFQKMSNSNDLQQYLCEEWSTCEELLRVLLQRCWWKASNLVAHVNIYYNVREHIME